MKDPEQLKKWTRNMCRENFVPTVHSRLCSIHFELSEFQTESEDTNVTRRKSAEEAGSSTSLQKVRLKPNAVPTLFDIPAYLQRKKTPEKRETFDKVSKEARRSVEQAQQRRLEEEFLDSDIIITLDDIEAQLNSESIVVPKGFTILKSESRLSLSLIDVGHELGPYVLAAIVIMDNLEYTLYRCGAVVQGQLLMKRVSHRSVLLGQFQSDQLERRFSWYRQLSGGNYYISLRQLYQNEKHIRIHSLMKFSRFEIGDLMAPSNEVEFNQNVESVAISFRERVSKIVAQESYSPEESDLKVVYYISGALVRSEVWMRNCEECRNTLVVDGEISTLPFFTEEEEVSADVTEFLASVNRGGLYVPTAEAFGIGIKSWVVFETLQKDSEVREHFMRFSSKRELFVELVLEMLKVDAEFEDITISSSFMCKNGHNYVRSLVGRFYNCMGKNLAKRLTDDADVARAANQKKIPKLTSQKK